MYIDHRKPKKYSDKLFKELCFLWLLINGEGRAECYMLNLKLLVSGRTLFRYAKELHECGLFPELSKRIVKKNGTTSEFFGFDPSVFEQYKAYYLHEHKDEKYCWYDFEKFIVDYPRRNALPDDKQNRLYRCGLLLAVNRNAMMPVDALYGSEPIPENEKIYVFNDEEYLLHFNDRCEDLYKKMSPRSMQRDISLVKDVILYMFEGW